jgi:hypothetical protein
VRSFYDCFVTQNIVFDFYVFIHAFLMSHNSNGEIIRQHNTAGGETLWVTQWNLSLTNNVYSAEDLESRGSRFQVRVLNGTFLRRKSFRSLKIQFRKFQYIWINRGKCKYNCL